LYLGRGLQLEMIDSIPTPVISFGGSAVAGFFMGWALRKILKILVIVIGAFFGVVFLVVALTYIGDNIAYQHGLHFCQEVYPYRNQDKV
jgi:uncharacterized membrane protein (Fun14 family)